jgi:hypothetical protein
MEGRIEWKANTVGRRLEDQLYWKQDGRKDRMEGEHTGYG